MAGVPGTTRLPAAVLFDMDGTLVDSESLWLEAETLTMAAMGATWTAEDQAYSLGGPLERVIAYMVRKAGGRHDAAEVSDTLLTHIERLMSSQPLAWRPGAAALLDSVREAGVPRALVSASFRSLLDAVHGAVLHEMGSDVFDVTVAGDEVPDGKPHPAPYLIAAERLGVGPARCVVVEDSPTGVASGLAAGMLVVAVPHLVEIAAADRLVVVDTLEGLTVADLGMWLEDHAA